MWIRSYYLKDKKPKLPSAYILKALAERKGTSQVTGKLHFSSFSFTVKWDVRGDILIFLYINYLSSGFSCGVLVVKKPSQFLTSSLSIGQKAKDKRLLSRSPLPELQHPNHWPFFVTSDQCCHPHSTVMIKIILWKQMPFRLQTL